MNALSKPFVQLAQLQRYQVIWYNRATALDQGRRRGRMTRQTIQFTETGAGKTLPLIRGCVFLLRYGSGAEAAKDKWI